MIENILIAVEGSPEVQEQTADPAAESLFAGGGDMRRLCRELDWSETPLGPVSLWPGELRTAVRLMLETPVATCLWCGPSYTLIYNEAYRRILGVKHPSALGKSGSDVWDELWPALEKQFDQVRTGGPPVYEDESLLTMERLEGGEAEDAWFTYSLSALTNEAGECIAVYNLGIEITEKVRVRQAITEERARLFDAFQRVPSFISLVTGPNHVLEYANAAYFDFVGRTDILGMPVWEAVPDARGQGFEELLDSVRRTGVPVAGTEVPVKLVRTPGQEPEVRYVNFLYQALTDADGTCWGVMGYGSDVTEEVQVRRDVERLLDESERARAEAEAANRAKGQFLATMSHELRTPLNAIGGYAELLEMELRGPLTQAQRDDLRRIQVSQRHLLGLINDVLNYAKLETGTVRYEISNVSIGEALAAAESLVAPQALAKGLVLDVIECREGLTAEGDADKLRQVLVNLLSNAIKFTEPGGSIRLRCEENENWVRISVEDTGIGIPPGQLDAIFDPFVQVRADLARPHEGTGLGLAISRDLARGMGGDLTAESLEGAGSTFTLTLPNRRVG